MIPFFFETLETDSIGPSKGHPFGASQFYGSLSPDHRTKIDKLTKELDDKVRIDKCDHRYKPIYDGIDVIVKRICKHMALSHSSFVDVKCQLTGSISSRTKVGLPHEADYLLKIPAEKFRTDLPKQFYAIMTGLVNTYDIRETLTTNLDGFIIIGVKPIKTIGVCLEMAYQSRGTTVGVAVDLVIMGEIYSMDTNLGNLPEMYLRLKQGSPALQQKIYRLCDQPHSFDTGVIENEILTKLPPGMLRGYRVAKYLVQYCMVNSCFVPTVNRLSDIHTYFRLFGNDRSEELFGYEPLIRSYVLRCLFLHLLGKGIRLTDGALTLCLLDLVEHVLQRDGNMVIKRFHHPISDTNTAINYIGFIQRCIKVGWLFANIDNMRCQIIKVSEQFKRFALDGNLEYYNLLNTDNPELKVLPSYSVTGAQADSLNNSSRALSTRNRILNEKVDSTTQTDKTEEVTKVCDHADQMKRCCAKIDALELQVETLANKLEQKEKKSDGRDICDHDDQMERYWARIVALETQVQTLTNRFNKTKEASTSHEVATAGPTVEH